MRKLIIGLIAIICVAKGQLCAGNLLINGDFEQGNIGFSSGYSCLNSGFKWNFSGRFCVSLLRRPHSWGLRSCPRLNSCLATP